ncbi:MAG: hypothetical protein AAGA48_08840 [Myxococcota bacterium]
MNLVDFPNCLIEGGASVVEVQPPALVAYRPATYRSLDLGSRFELGDRPGAMLPCHVRIVRPEVPGWLNRVEYWLLPPGETTFPPPQATGGLDVRLHTSPDSPRAVSVTVPVAGPGPSGRRAKLGAEWVRIEHPPDQGPQLLVQTPEGLLPLRVLTPARLTLQVQPSGSLTVSWERR